MPVTVMPKITCALLLLAALATPRCLLADNAEKIDGFTDTPLEATGKWHVHDPARPQPAVVTPGATFSQGAPAPSDAEVLFNGTGLDKWVNARGTPANWHTNEDYVETAPMGGGHSHARQMGGFSIARGMGLAESAAWHQPGARQ